MQRLRHKDLVGVQHVLFRWEQTMDSEVTWMELWQSEPHRITFLIPAGILVTAEDWQLSVDLEKQLFPAHC